MTIIDTNLIHKSYGSHNILDGISLNLRSGERVGLMGANGSGKSTLARILASLETPDSGNIAVRRGARVVYLPQCPTLQENHSIREEVMSGLTHWRDAERRYQTASAALSDAASSKNLDALLKDQAQAAAEVELYGGWDISYRAETILGHLGISRLDERVGNLSGGEQRRVGLARILVAAPDLAILDEPTNHLDVATVEWLEQYLLKEFKGALLLITHDRYVLERVAQRILELEQGKLYSYDGGYEDFLESKAERLALEARIEANRQNFLRREIEWLRRQPKARTTKQKARLQRAEEVLALNAPTLPQQVTLSVEATRSGKAILELRNLRLSIADRVLMRSLDLSLVKGQRIGVIGSNGCGKTTFMRTIVGDGLSPAAGQIIVGKNTTLLYLSQMRDGLDPSKSILDNITDHGSHVVIGDRAIDARSYLARFLFPPEKITQPVQSLSGGERTRVALAKLFLNSANLLMLDEPANDLDLPTISALEQMLIEFEGTALIVTHDRWFLDRVATGILAFEADGQVTYYAGNYTTYLSQRPALPKIEEKIAKPADAKRQPNKKTATLTYGERLELASLMEKIEAAETQVALFETQLADPLTYSGKNHNDVSNVVSSLEQARQEVTRLMNRWEELELKNQK